MQKVALFLVCLVVLSTDIRAQHEVRCKYDRQFGQEVLLGNCTTTPQLWKRVTYKNPPGDPLPNGVWWYRICDICNNTSENDLHVTELTNPSVFSSGACSAIDGFVIEECYFSK